VSATGSLTATASYDAWGRPTTSLSSYTPQGFAGSYTDATGLVYLINRYYEPITGQLTVVDPVVESTGQAYIYGDSNPVNITDPLGKAVVGICGGVSGAYIGFVGRDACLVRTVYEPWDDIGFTNTRAVGLGTPGVSIYGGVVISNAAHICDLGGWFYELSGSAIGFGGAVFGGTSPCGGGFIYGVVLQAGGL